MKTKKLTQAGVLTAVTLVLGLTTLGIIPIPPANVTIMHLPVIIGTLTCGLGVGLVLGGVFGLSSVYAAFTQMCIRDRPLDEFWIIRQILAGPLEGEDADARPLIADTRLTSSFLGGRLSGNLAVLDFDRSFYSYAETLSDGETRLLIYALVNSLTEERCV